jgi:hypothetical protein
MKRILNLITLTDTGTKKGGAYNRRTHGSLGNKTPTYIWNRYNEQQLIREQQMRICTEALCTNGERKSVNIEKSRLVDKVLEKKVDYRRTLKAD